MNAAATTTISVLRGVASVTTYGDPVDDTTPVTTGIPASILERRRSYLPASGSAPETVISYTGRVRSGTDVRVDDRVLDERSGDMYVVDSVANVANPVMRNDTRLDLRRVT